MSEQDNVQIVQQIYAAFGRGDIRSVLNALAPDVEFISPPSTNSLPWSGTHNGREGAGQFFQMLAGVLNITRFEPREYIAQGDKVVALGYEAGSSRSTGRSFEMDFAHVWTVRDGQAVKWQDFYDTAIVAATLEGS